MTMRTRRPFTVRPGRCEDDGVMLAYLRDRSRHDLSVRLGIPANTIKTHLRRALLQIRATMFASIDAGIGKVA
jgi:hypothetical protein